MLLNHYAYGRRVGECGRTVNYPTVSEQEALPVEWMTSELLFLRGMNFCFEPRLKRHAPAHSTHPLGFSPYPSALSALFRVPPHAHTGAPPKFSRIASAHAHAQGCASARKFANICELISEICEFHLEKLIHFYIQNVFSTRIVITYVLLPLQICQFLLIICEIIWRSAHPCNARGVSGDTEKYCVRKKYNAPNQH